MLCSNPLIKIKDTQTTLLNFNNGQQYISFKWFNPKNRFNELVRSGSIQVLGCSNCKNCINMKRFHWVLKLSLEKQNWKNTYFITLTYNDDNLPTELKVRDMQKFIMYLRKSIKPYNLKYFCSGEYGSRTARPHYHLILFTNYEFDLKFLKNTNNGPLYDCELLNKCWLNKGYIWVGHDIDDMSFAYVSSYSNKNYLKKTQNFLFKKFEINKQEIYSRSDLKGFQKYLMVDALIPDICFRKHEFIIMSKKPPIGSSSTSLKNMPSSLIKWFEKQLLKNNKLNGSNFDTELFLNNPFRSELVKRQNDFLFFLKNNNIFDMIINEGFNSLKNDFNNLKGFL